MPPRLWMTLPALAFTIAPVCSQTLPKSPPVLKVETNVVLVDVVVTDGKGDPVPNLHQSDFQVLENGVPQSISFFEEHTGVDPAPVKVPPMPPHVFTNLEPVRLGDSVNVLLLDWLNTQPQDQSYVLAEVTKYLQSLPPGSRLAIFAMGSGLHMVQGLTSDVAGLQAALNAKKSAAAPQVSPLLPTDIGESAEQTMIQMMEMNLTAAAAIEAARDEMAAHAASNASRRVTITLNRLHQLVRYLSTIPGRKNVIWFAGSFPIDFFPERGLPREYAGELQETANLLTPSQVSIYPVSAEGLHPDRAWQALYSHGPSILSENFRRAGDQLAMEKLAEDTGGQAFYNTNDLATAITRAVNDGSRYYTLTYSPSNKTFDGKYRKIRLQLKHQNYKLSYRRGYYADAPKPQDDSPRDPSNDHLLPFVAFGLPNFHQILFKVRVLPSTPQPSPNSPRAGANTGLVGPATRYSVDFALSVDDLKLKATPDGLRHDVIEEMLVAYGPDGKPLNLAARNLALAIPPNAYAYYQRVGFQLHEEIDVPNGEAYLRSAIYDGNSGQVGTLQIPLSITPPH